GVGMKTCHRLLLVSALLLGLSAGTSWAGSRTPTMTTLPVVTGQTVVGQTLSSSTGKWAGSVSSYAYQWLRCDGAGSCAPIAGAPVATYLLGSADVGFTLRAIVSATNAVGTTSATSAATPVVAPAAIVASPSSSTPPQVTGLAQTGQTLTTSTGSWA